MKCYNVSDGIRVHPHTNIQKRDITMACLCLSMSTLDPQRAWAATVRPKNKMAARRKKGSLVGDEHLEVLQFY
jgi:hypothetical protein